MKIIAANLAKLRYQIHSAAQRYHREADSVKLLAISKGQSIEKIKAAFAAGQTCFGENYLQEAFPKIAALPKLEWHFVGQIQANKTKQIAENFTWAHSVSRLKIAERLNAQRPANLAPLNICLEVNISGEASKSGITLAELPILAAAIIKLPRLKLRGLMTIPAPSADFATQRIPYAQLHSAYQNLLTHGFALDTLSMGMSDDFVAAIAEGSTIVRIGTALFGKRQ